MTTETGETGALLRAAQHGDQDAFARLFSAFRPRLRRLVDFRLDSRLRGRVDADDILQEAWLDAVQRRAHFSGTSDTEFFLWLRLVVRQTLINVHRRHIGAQARDAGRELPLRGGASDATTASLVITLVGALTTPTRAVRRAELSAQLERVLAEMDEIDREVLVLRHFEELSNAEVAAELNIEQKAASMRYVRALRRLKEILAALPGFTEEFQSRR